VGTSVIARAVRLGNTQTRAVPADRAIEGARSNDYQGKVVSGSGEYVAEEAPDRLIK
jgi:hypothetical protein